MTYMDRYKNMVDPRDPDKNEERIACFFVIGFILLGIVFGIVSLFY